MLQGSGLSYKAGAREILCDISIQIRPGEFTAIAGPNGAGKSTLLKLLAHEYKTTAGSVTINGQAIEQLRPAELAKLRAVLPQSSHLQFSFSVEQIILLARYGNHTTKKQNENILEEVMTLTNTLSFRHRNYQTLSGGEKQRVQFARVLAQIWDKEAVYPRYILLDEPTSSLDMAQQQLIFKLARQVCSRNVGVLAIAHDLNHTIQFAHQLYFLRHGKIVAGGEALKVFTKPIIEETFCCRVNVYQDPCNHCPYIVPDNRPEDHHTSLKLMHHE
ncbi:MAG: heme ABC transporter ATP-binding protein [Bacteroidota bacterium]